MENRNGLVRGVCLNRASGTAERDAALALVHGQPRGCGITLGADRGYDARDFIAALRARSVTPHIAVDTRTSSLGNRRRSAMDERETEHPGYAASQRLRKRIEEVFGWVKGSAGLRQTKFRGVERVGWSFSLAATAYNLIRLPRLLGTPA